jgi:predicted acetyltransferase
VALDFRSPAEDEARAVMAAASVAFGGELREEDFERERASMPADRMLAAYDDGRPVGLAGSYAFELTVPGGQVPAAGVTWVGVLPSHRRRGVLRNLMRLQLEDVRARGEPLAILWASEAAIYGRFGYGISAPSGGIDARRDGFALRDDPGPAGAVRIVEREEARGAFRDVYERVRVARPGMLSRSERWWDEHRLADPEHWRQGASPKFYALLELDGRPEGYAMYRIASKWERGFPEGTVRVSEAIATSPEATRELWRFLFGIDLVVRVNADIFDPASPVFLMVVDPRRLHLTLSDGLWLRFVDVEAALAVRAYGDGEPAVVELLDELCPWNEGRFRLGDGVERTEDAADVRLRVGDLASLYLGGFDVWRLAGAARVEELRPGGLERLDALLRTRVAPFCPEIF